MSEPCCAVLSVNVEVAADLHVVTLLFQQSDAAATSVASRL